MLEELRRFGIVPMQQKALPHYIGPEIELDVDDVTDVGSSDSDNDEVRSHARARLHAAEKAVQPASPRESRFLTCAGSDAKAYRKNKRASAAVRRSSLPYLALYVSFAE